MSETKVRDGTVLFVCGGPFGIGTYRFIDHNGVEQHGYGIWHPENPNDFTPDFELCTADEIARWEAAKEEWAKKVSGEK